MSKTHALFWIALIIVSGFCFAWRSQKRQRDMAVLFGQMSRAQAFEQSLPICRAIAPQITNLRLQANQSPIGDRGAAYRHQWSVECADTANHPVAHLLWDADAGELLSVAGLLPREASSLHVPLTAAETAQTARTWSKLLGCMKSNDSQQLQHYFIKGDDISLSIRSENRALFLRFDRFTGQLVQAISKRRACLNSYD